MLCLFCYRKINLSTSNIVIVVIKQSLFLEVTKQKKTEKSPKINPTVIQHQTTAKHQIFACDACLPLFISNLVTCLLPLFDRIEPPNKPSTKKTFLWFVITNLQCVLLCCASIPSDFDKSQEKEKVLAHLLPCPSKKGGVGREGKKGSRVGNDRGGGVFQFCSMLFAAASGLFAVELSTSTTTHLFEVTRDGFESQNYSLCFGSSRRRSKRVFAPQKTMLERTK